MQSAKNEVAGGARELKSRWLNRERMVVYAAVILGCQLFVLTTWAVRWMLHEPGMPPMGADFRVFWSASYVTLHQTAVAAFDPVALGAVEDRLFAGYYAPWVYPPTFQLLVYPLALLPYGISYACFCAIGIACLLRACAPAVARGALPWVAVVAFPGIWVAVAHGQNALVTAALAAGALGLLERRPWIAGVCAGMLVLKPQLAVLFPLLFLCGRHFRALAAMGVTAAVFAAISTLVFGVSLWGRFFEAASWFNTVVVSGGTSDVLRAMPSVFALVRRLGGGLPVAYVVHAAVAIPVVLTTLTLWARGARFEVRSAAAVIATLLVQPYVLYYDLTWLLLPIVYLCGGQTRWIARTGVERVIVALAWWLPLLSMLPTFFPSVLQPGVVVLPALFVVVVATNFRTLPQRL